MRDPEKRVVLESIPEPFIGNPDSARVVLLGLNPGHSPEDVAAHRDADLEKAMFHNLRHEMQDYPFYPLNPRFASTPVACWWRLRTREFKEASGLDDMEFAKRLLVIEWFPYHSKKSALKTKQVCPSQQYSFSLARKMLEGKLVIPMRSKKHWAEVGAQFGSEIGKRFADMPSLSNPLVGYVSEGNMPADLFKQVIRTLRAE